MSKVTIKIWCNSLPHYLDDKTIDSLRLVVCREGKVNGISKNKGLVEMGDLEAHYYKDGERIA